MTKKADKFRDYEIQEGSLVCKGKLVMDHASPLIPQILRECHSTLLWGHGGIQKTTARVFGIFIWPGLHKDVKKYVQNCVICQQMKSDCRRQQGYFNLFLYQTKFERMLLWTSSLAYLIHMAILPFWWLWIDCLSKLILEVWQRLTLLRKWQSCFHKWYVNCMVFQGQLSHIVILFFE